MTISKSRIMVPEELAKEVRVEAAKRGIEPFEFIAGIMSFWQLHGKEKGWGFVTKKKTKKGGKKK